MTQYYVTASALNIREKPDLKAAVIGILHQNEMVDMLEMSPDGNWLKIKTYRSLIGWCARRYLSPTSDIPGGDTSGIGKYLVKARALTLRAGPGVSYRALGYLYKNETVACLEGSANNAWLKVKKANGMTGWSSSAYLTKLSPIPGDEAAAGQHRVTANNINVHEGPGLDYPILDTLQQEQIVNVLGISADWQWKKIITVRGLSGWCDLKFLVSLGDEAAIHAGEEFPWMPIIFGEMGIRETPGTPATSRILEYLQTTDAQAPASQLDETDWSAAFVNWCVQRSGVTGTGSAQSAPWMAWGQALSAPRRGCITILRWEDGRQQVAFYLGGTDECVHVLGGDQSDAVWIASYPWARVTGYRIPAAASPGGDQSPAGGGERWIELDLSEQKVYARERNALRKSFIVSTGTAQHPTVTGEYRIYVKLTSTTMSGPGYYLPNVPYTMYFYQGYGLHGTYWHNNFGTPMSHGCVNLKTPDAEWLFNWASVGTRVVIHQ